MWKWYENGLCYEANNSSRKITTLRSWISNLAENVEEIISLLLFACVAPAWPGKNRLMLFRRIYGELAHFSADFFKTAKDSDHIGK